VRPDAILLTLDEAPVETVELVESLGYDVAEVIQQNRNHPDPQTYLGSGKLRGAAERLATIGAEVVAVDEDLKPGQIFHIQRLVREELDDRGALDDLWEQARHNYGDGIEGPSLDPTGGPFEVVDRIRLILEIFRERAPSKEARLQVELAKLRYEMPIVREAIHRAKTGEHPGVVRGGGEYGVDTYYERMEKRRARIREELDRISDQRKLRRKHRRRGGFHLVSLAGYTNAGKSSLLSALTDEKTPVEDRVFTTLGTRTRRFNSSRRDILLTDTVGFIADLPPWIVEAFHSTLEEIALADVILLVVDASDAMDEIERKLESSLDILRDFAARRLDGDGASGNGASGAGDEDARPEALAPILVVFNKVDRLEPGGVGSVAQRLEEQGTLTHEWVATSALDGTGLDVLHDKVVDLLESYDEYEVRLPQSPDTEAFLAWLHDEADVRSVDRGEEILLEFEAKQDQARRIDEEMADLGAVVLEGPDSLSASTS
jgi:GTP-binding protein HflX